MLLLLLLLLFCSYCCTYVCMLLLMMVALVFSHPTRHETIKLLLASATSLVTRVAHPLLGTWWLKNCQAQRANEAEAARPAPARGRGSRFPRHHCHEAFSFHCHEAISVHRPRAGAGWAVSTACWHSASTAPKLALDGQLPLPAGIPRPPPPSWRWMGSFHFLLA